MTMHTVKSIRRVLGVLARRHGCNPNIVSTLEIERGTTSLKIERPNRTTWSPKVNIK